jgi:hypothetical protein
MILDDLRLQRVAMNVQKNGCKTLFIFYQETPNAPFKSTAN